MPLVVKRIKGKSFKLVILMSTQTYLTFFCEKTRTVVVSIDHWHWIMDKNISQNMFFFTEEIHTGLEWHAKVKFWGELSL